MGQIAARARRTDAAGSSTGRCLRRSAATDCKKRNPSPHKQQSFHIVHKHSPRNGHQAGISTLHDSSDSHDPPRRTALAGQRERRCRGCLLVRSLRFGSLARPGADSRSPARTDRYEHAVYARLPTHTPINGHFLSSLLVCCRIQYPIRFTDKFLHLSCFTSCLPHHILQFVDSDMRIGERDAYEKTMTCFRVSTENAQRRRSRPVFSQCPQQQVPLAPVMTSSRQIDAGLLKQT